ncbi:carbamoyltransferase [Allocatelliglobosispora scoriae]|uniref:Carbamoyltransferase n=1 Tax=Allocatelliglobosispora scoriae TaxID=643052 RepID=A0A841C5F4_9ACTN|nr:carbamoyltransferase C-terminal domain-containing protein [Allocatelliglobosispora scoriae]MBB5874180.1 carbamoyltransferase [Allocatelliglobosispora scoriae]
MYVLGINQHHDSAAALVRDGEIVAFLEEERVSRVKHDGTFPAKAVRTCLEMAGITLSDVDHVAYFWQARKEVTHALTHFVRHLPDTLAVFRNDAGTYDGKAAGMAATLRSGGIQSHSDDYHVGGALLLHLRRSLTLKKILCEAIGHTGPVKFKVHLVDHHISHAASTYLLSPFDRAAIITWDGIGNGTSTYLGVGTGDRIRDIRRVAFPHSLGALYACVTSYLGFHPTRDEGKVMGLAAYGRPEHVAAMSELVRLLPDGRYELDLSWFRHHATGKHQMSPKFVERFGPPRARSRDAVPQHYADIAYGLQVTLEEAGLHVARWLQEHTGETNLVTAGGVALNSVMNGRLLLETGFEEFFAQPAAADDGSALGAALSVSVGHGAPRPTGEYIFLGPSYGEAEMEKALADAGLAYRRADEITDTTASALADGKIVGWFQGRMECGPRALGNRSILGDPRGKDTKDRLNEKVKHRETFRPFAPSCLEERSGEYFASGYRSPVMLLVFDVLEHQRERVPAITHADGTARVQTVSAADNPLYHRMITRFDELTGVPMVVNTSFNDNEEPIVCTPAEAVSCYLRTDMDALALGPFWTEK